MWKTGTLGGSWTVEVVGLVSIYHESRAWDCRAVDVGLDLLTVRPSTAQDAAAFVLTLSADG